MNCEVGIDPRKHTVEGQFMSCLEKGHHKTLNLSAYSKSLAIYSE